MDRFFENARRIFDTASAAGDPADATIVVTQEGGLRILSDSDWPLDRLVAHLGADSAYRVTSRRGVLTVEGRSRTQSCRMEKFKCRRPAGSALLLPAA
jgi:hypothetical protein